MRLLHLIAATISGQRAQVATGEAGFESFYQDFIILEPIPSIQWECGSMQTIRWNIGENIASSVVTVPPTPASGNVNIHLVQASNITNTDNLTKYTIAMNVPIVDSILNFEVDCIALSQLCSDCLTDDGSAVLLEESGLFHQRWDYLLFEDPDLYADSNAGCELRGLNYDKDACWSVRSEGSVQIVNVQKPYLNIPEEEIFTIDNWWYNSQNAPLGQHLWGVSTALSHRLGWYIEQDTVLDMTRNGFDYGLWDVVWSNFTGVLGGAILRSQVENVVAVVFRPTRNVDGLFWDDWMTNFNISQRGCQGIIENCDPNFKFHRGFLYELVMMDELLMREALLAVVRENPCTSDDGTWRLLFTGMSQGAGIAAVAYYDYMQWLEVQLGATEMDRIIPILHTTGAPPQGNEHWALYIEETLPTWARERFVLSFDPAIGFADGNFRVRNIGVLNKELADLEGVAECTSRKPPQGDLTPAYAGWTWQSAGELGLEDATDDELLWANSSAWVDGDFITMMHSNTSCKGLDGMLSFDSRFIRVYDPVFIHWDPSAYMPWCTEDGCDEGLGGHDPAHPNSKGPIKLYTSDYVHYPGEARRDCVNDEGKGFNPGLNCHDVGMYAFSIAKNYNDLEKIIDYMGWRAGDVDFAGCSATGTNISLQNDSYSPIVPTTEKPEEEGAYSVGLTATVMVATVAATLY